MKKTILLIAIAAVVLAAVIEAVAWVKGWRPAPLSFNTALSFAGFCIFLFGIMLAGYLASRKIAASQGIGRKGKCAAATLALACSCVVIYFDDGRGFRGLLSLGGVIMTLVLSFFLFIVFSLALLLRRG